MNETWATRRFMSGDDMATALNPRTPRRAEITDEMQRRADLVGAVLVDMNETWATRRFMSGDDMATALNPRTPRRAEITDEMQRRADQIIMTALESAA